MAGQHLYKTSTRQLNTVQSAAAANISMAEDQREKFVIEVIENKRRILNLEVERKELKREIVTTVLHSEETWKKEEET